MPAATITQTPLDAIAAALRERDDFLILGHFRADGDCLGSVLGMAHILHDLGKRARIFVLDPLPRQFAFLPGYEAIETTPPDDPPPNLIYLDSADPFRVHDTWRPPGFTINIDHHITNTRYGDINWVNDAATSASEMVYELAMALALPLTRPIAECLYTGIMTDSGGFRYGNTTRRTFEVAAHLTTTGISPSRIAEHVFDSRNPGSVKVTGEVYANLKFEFDGQFVWGEVTREQLHRNGLPDGAEPEGLSSDLRGIDGVQISALFFEHTDGNCRVGLRSRDTVDVGILASNLGGGGHRNASGAFIRKPYKQAREWALAEIRRYIREESPQLHQH